MFPNQTSKPPNNFVAFDLGMHSKHCVEIPIFKPLMKCLSDYNKDAVFEHKLASNTCAIIHILYQLFRKSILTIKHVEDAGDLEKTRLIDYLTSGKLQDISDVWIDLCGLFRKQLAQARLVVFSVHGKLLNIIRGEKHILPSMHESCLEHENGVIELDRMDNVIMFCPSSKHFFAAIEHGEHV